MTTSLGDQGSQVRALSPRFAVHCTAVQPFPLSCSRFQLAGISHFTGTSPHTVIDDLSCKTTLSPAPSPAGYDFDVARVFFDSTFAIASPSRAPTASAQAVSPG
jgi:hypothetical protein